MAYEECPSDEIDRIMMGFPAGMRECIAEAAKDNNHSMNAEIVSRLQASLDGPRPGCLLTPDGLRAIRSYAETTNRMPMQLKAVTTEAGNHAVSIIAERGALEAVKGERDTPSAEPD